MYLEIKDLTNEEFEELKEKFKDRARNIFSIYHEMLMIEADCSIERVIDELDKTLSVEEYKQAMEDIAEELASECEDNAFQEICEQADEITRRYFA